MACHNHRRSVIIEIIEMESLLLDRKTKDLVKKASLFSLLAMSSFKDLGANFTRFFQ